MIYSTTFNQSLYLAMQLNVESSETHSIQAYAENEIKINHQLYKKNLIVSERAIIPEWPLQELSQLTEEDLVPMLQFNPKIILIGQHLNQFAPPKMIAWLGQQGIGIETMSIGAACRTFNVLLGEGREVVLGILFSNQ